MASIRLKDEPAATAVASDDVFMIDGLTNGVRALNKNAVPAVAAGKVVTIANSIALAAGADGQTFTLPSTSATLARTDAGQTFTGANTFGTINKVTITAPAVSAVLTIPDGVTLTGPAASGTVMTLGNAETVAGVKSFNDATLVLKGVTSGTTTLKSGGTAGSSVLTLPVATDTLVGKTTTDVLTNKTLDSAGTGNVLKVSGVTVGAGQYPGETTTGSATAGNVGEYVESIVVSGSATALVNATDKTVTSITLSAGDWEVDAIANFLTAASTSVTAMVASFSTTTNVSDISTAGRFNQLRMVANVPGAVSTSVPIPNYRFSLSGSTTIFLVVFSAFTVSTQSAWGIIRARRAR